VVTVLVMIVVVKKLVIGEQKIMQKNLQKNW